MISRKLGALAAALLLSSGIVFISTLPGEAAGVRAAVGADLKEAIADAEHGNASAANEKIREAESEPNLTPSEREVIDQTKNYVAAKTGNFSGGGGSATAAKAKFANDYNAGRYSAVVGEDVDLLRKFGAYDADSQVIVAQAYYLMHNYPECISRVRAMGRVGQSTLELLMRCAYESHDEQAMQGALEQLVVDYNQPKYWSDLLDSATRSSSLSNEDTLDLYRLRLLTSTMKNNADYETAAEISIQLGFPTEAETFTQKGLDAKLLPADRGARLLNMAKMQAAADAAGMAKATAQAAAAKTGDAYLKVGEDYWGMGRYQDALTAIKAGIAKGPTNPDAAQILLAMTYIGLHQRDQAVHALNQVSKTAPPHTLTIAHMWSIYARSH